MDYVIYTLIGSNLLAFSMLLYARARLGKLERALGDLDWEALAGLVGDVAVLKRTIQKLNMRLNGMETSDPMAALQKLVPLQPNVTSINKTQNFGG